MQYISVAGFYDFYKISNHAFSLPHFWLLCLLVPVMTISVDVAISAVSRGGGREVESYLSYLFVFVYII